MDKWVDEYFDYIVCGLYFACSMYVFLLITTLLDIIRALTQYRDANKEIEGREMVTNGEGESD